MTAASTYFLIFALLVALAYVKLDLQSTNSLDQFNKNNNLLNYKILFNILDPKGIAYSGSETWLMVRTTWKRLLFCFYKKDYIGLEF